MIDWLEWLGYLASLIVLISLLMSSIKKLRWINLVGSSIFAIYGFLIGALPVAFMNLGIAAINIYYLYQIYNTKEYFKTLEIDQDSEYLKSLIEFYKGDIDKHIGKVDYDLNEATFKLFILRNMAVAGVFICSEFSKDTLEVELDFVIPEYRDFKIGKYIFDNQKDIFINKGYNKFVSFTSNPEQIKYLLRMGFEAKVIESKQCYVKLLK